MSGSLVLRNKYHVETDGTSATINLTGINTNNPYKLIISGLRLSSYDGQPFIRVTKGGSAQNGANYVSSYFYRYFFAAGSQGTITGQTEVYLTRASGFGDRSPTTYPERSMQVVEIDLFGFNDSNSYDWINSKTTFTNWQDNGFCNIQSSQYRVQSASDGISLQNNLGDVFTAGLICLYEVV